MRIEYSLTGLHPSYGAVVRQIMDGLAVDYPLDSDLRVETYAKAGDKSVGCSSETGVIQLNRYWFSRPLDELQAAMRASDLVSLGSDVVVPWHGMTEPQHILAHEYGHQLQDCTPWWREFAESHWQQACLYPTRCRPPSGYSLASPDEFWADAFAAMRLNYPSETTRLLRERFAEGKTSA